MMWYTIITKEGKVCGTMKHREFNSIITMIMTLALVVMSIAIATLLGMAKEDSKTAQSTSTMTHSNIDTSAIDKWGGDYSDGTIRMIGAWYYGTQPDGLLTLEDETGELWSVDTSIDEQDFLLLWIADNNTPDDTHDDIVVKVWAETHK